MIYLVVVAYIVSAIMFVFGLKMLGKATTARRGNGLSSLGMLIAIIATVLSIIDSIQVEWVVLAAVIGAGIGIAASRLVKMTGMPEMVALFNGFGGLASMLVGWGTFQAAADQFGVGFGAGAGAGNLADFSAALGGGFSATTIYLAILIGGVTFTGSIVAWGKLSEVITSRPVQFPLQQVVNALVLLSIVAGGVWFTVAPDQYWIAVMVTSAISKRCART